MNILLVCYYCPPVGMGGVQRPAKFAKYLARAGHRVTVITAVPDDNLAADESLLADIPDDVRVIRTPAPHPRNLVRRLGRHSTANRDSSTRRNRRHRRLAAWSRVPDDKIGFGLTVPAVARKVFAAQRPDVIMTTSPPPSIHLIGRKLQKLWGCPWVADFRDPWFQAADEWLPTPIHRAIRSRILGTVFRQADRVTVVSPGIADDFRDMGLDSSGLTVIPNGYDESDFVGREGKFSTLEARKFRFHLYGTVSPQAPPDRFLAALADWRAANEELAKNIEVSHRGSVRGIDFKSVLDRYRFGDRFVSLGYAPHWYAVGELSEAHALVVSVAERPGLRSNIPGRIYECLRSNRPIVAFVPERSSVAEILRQFDGVWIIDPRSPGRFHQVATNLLNDWQIDPRPQTIIRESVEHYSRERLTGELFRVMEQVVEGRS